MKKTTIICLVIALVTLLSAGTAKALQILGADVAKVGELETGSLKVGQQGVGGVTFFNGTIINETTTNGVGNPITFGDDVRIDGRVWRGKTAGAGDGKPFIINDDEEVVGNLTVGGNSTITGDSTVKGSLTVNSINFPNSKASISASFLDNTTVYVRDNMYLNKDLDVWGDLNVLWGESKFYGYVRLGQSSGQPPSDDCSGLLGGPERGRMKFDPWDNKLWVCGYPGWKSFSADEVTDTLENISCSYKQIPQKDVSGWKCVNNTDDSIGAFFDCISSESIGNEYIKVSDWNYCKTKWVWWF